MAGKGEACYRAALTQKRTREERGLQGQGLQGFVLAVEEQRCLGSSSPGTLLPEPAAFTASLQALLPPTARDGAWGRGCTCRPARTLVPCPQGRAPSHLHPCKGSHIGVPIYIALQAPRVHIHTLNTVRLPTSARQPKAVGCPSFAAHIHAPAPSCSTEKQQNPPPGESTPSLRSGMGTVVMTVGTSIAPALGLGLGEQPTLPCPPRRVSPHLHSGSSGNRSVKRGHRKG